MNGVDKSGLNFVLFGLCLFNYTLCVVSLSGELHAGLSSAFASSMRKPAWQIHQNYRGVSELHRIKTTSGCLPVYLKCGVLSASLHNQLPFN